MKDLKLFFEEINNGINNVDENSLRENVIEFINGLNAGSLRTAEPDGNGNWRVNSWVKQAILTLFKIGKLKDMSIDNNFKFFDKDTIPLKDFSIENNIRIVPGGSSVRTGAYLAPGVICMPPMYINIGAYIDEGTMIDSHALVGSAAQIGKRVHISAAAQVGGVLEPAGARPVIIEDDVMVGGNCGIYEGVMLRKRVVLGSGVILTASTKVFDLVNESVLQSTPEKPLEIPESAVVVPGTRAINTDFGKKYGLTISSPLIIKYRNDKTDARTSLNYDLR